MGANLESLLGAPRDPHGPLAYDQRADQGVNGAPVPAPSPYAQGVGQLLGPAPDPNAAPGGAPVGLTQGAGPAANTAPADPTRGMDALTAAKYRVANGLPVSPQDMMVLDSAQQQYGAGGGGMSSTTVTRMKQNDSEELRRLRAERDRTEANMGERYKQLGNAQQDEATQRSMDLAVRADQLREEAAAAQTRQEVQAQTLQRMQSDADRASRDYVKAAESIDPNRIMTGGKRVTASIAMALGAAGAVLGRSQNFAKDIIDGELARDLDAQKTALGAKRDSLTHMQQAFQNYRSIYQDDAAARAATRATAYEAFAADLSSRAAKLQGTEQKAAALNQRDQLILASNAAKQEAAQIAAGRMQISTTSQSGGGASGQPVDLISRLSQYAGAAKALNEQNGQNAGPDEKDKSQYNTATEKAAPWLTVLRQADRLRGLADKTNALDRASGMGEAGRAWESNFNTFKASYLQAITGAAFSPEQAKDAKALIEGQAYTSEQAKQKIDAAKNFILSQVQSHIGALHPQLQQQYRNRLQAGGMPSNLINEIGVGQTTSKAEEGAAMGGR